MVALAAAALMAGAQGTGGPGLTADVLKGIELRSIGPTLSTGRIADIADRSEEPERLVRRPARSAASGRPSTAASPSRRSSTTDRSFTLCCVVVDPKDSNVVWLGTGENASQRSAHFGDGVYKSTDAGKTWKRVGPGGVRAHRQDRDRPAQLERRLRGLAGPALVGRRRPRPLQDDRRRRHVAAGPDDQRRHRHQRRRHRSEEPDRPLRVGLPAAPGRRADDRRRARGRHLQDDRRRARPGRS